MAGDWIKMRSDLHLAPQFDRLCFEFQCGSGDLMLTLHLVAGWFEKHGRYGQMDVADAQAVDLVVRRQGLYLRLKNCGWIKEDGGKARLSLFCRPAATRKSLGAKLRSDVLSSGKCAACDSTTNLVVDHKTPVSRGGTGDRSNLQALCAPCNRAKGRKTMEEFMDRGLA